MTELRDRFEDFHRVEAPDLWDRIEREATRVQARPVRSVRPLAVVFGAAAVVLLLVGGTAWLLRADGGRPSGDGPVATSLPATTAGTEPGADEDPGPGGQGDDPDPVTTAGSTTVPPAAMVPVPELPYLEPEEPPATAAEMLSAAGFEVDLVLLVVPVEEREIEGLVAYIDPAPGTLLPEGSTVVVAVYADAELILTGEKPTGRWTTFTSGDGLASDCVSGGIDVADDGTVWVGCSDGLSRFDGTSWTVVSDDVVCHDLRAGADGEVWVMACDEEANLTVLRYDGGWTEYLTVITGDLAVAPDGSVWVAGGSMWRFDGAAFQRLTDGETGPSLWEVAVGGDGVVWAAGGEAGLWRYDGEWAEVPEGRGVEYIAADPAGGLWAGYEGATFFDGDRWHDLGLHGVRTIDWAFAPDGSVWVASIYSGAFRYDGTGWAQYTVADGLAGDRLTSVAVGPDGTVWFGTVDAGVTRFEPGA